MVHYNLMIEMYAIGLTELKLAAQLNLSEDQLHNKIQGLTIFTNKEIEIISTLFPHCKIEYLFQFSNKQKRSLN